MVYVKPTSIASVLVGAAALTASTASGAALPPTHYDQHGPVPAILDVKVNARNMQSVMMAPDAKHAAGPLAPAGADVKHIADGLHLKSNSVKPKSERAYSGDDVDFTTQPQPQNERRLWKGRQGKRGPRRQDQEEALINLDLDGVRGDSPVHGTLVDLDARGMPGRPRPVGHDQTQAQPQPQPAALPKPSEVPQKEEALISADLDGVRGDSKVKGQLVDIDARSLPGKHGDLISVDVDGVRGNSRSHGSVVDLDARSMPRKEQDLVNVDLDGVKDKSPAHGSLVDLDARSMPAQHVFSAEQAKRGHNSDRVVVVEKGDRVPDSYRVFGGRPHRFVSQSDMPLDGHVHVPEHDRRRHDDVVIVDGHEHGHGHHHHHHGHGHRHGGVVVVGKRRHNDDVIVVDGDRHGHYHGHGHHHGHRHGDVVVVGKRDGEDQMDMKDAEERAAGFTNGEGRPNVHASGSNEEMEHGAEADTEDGGVEGDAGPEHAEAGMEKRRHGHHGHDHGHHGHHGHGGVTIVDRDLETRRHHHDNVVVVDGHRHHRHRPLIEIDRRDVPEAEAQAKSIFDKVKSFLTPRRNRDTTIISTGRHRHDTTVVKTGRNGKTVIVDGHRHHRRHSTKIDVLNDDVDYADTVIYEDGHRHHHGRPFYIDSDHHHDGVKIVTRDQAEAENGHDDEVEDLAPLYKRHHHRGGRDRHCRHGRCRDDDDVVVIHHKRDVEMGGAPGYIDVTSPMFNSTTAQRIASLVLSTSNGTETNSSFVLNASNNIRTQVYLVPIASNETESAADASPIAVNLKVPIFVPSSAAVEPYCATFDPAPAAPAPMTVMPCTPENDVHQSQTFLYYADTGVIHPDWKPEPAFESLLNAMSDSVDDDMDGDDAEPQMSIDEIMSSSATATPTGSASASVSVRSASMMVSMTESSAAAMATESMTMPSSTSSIPELPSITPSASMSSMSSTAMGAAAAVPISSAPVSAFMPPAAAPSAQPASPSNVTLIFTPANPSAQSGSGMTSPAAASFESSEPTQEDMGSASDNAEMPASSSGSMAPTPSASGSSAAQPAMTMTPSASAAGAPADEPSRYPVTPSQTSYDPAASATPATASTESYNGPDVSDEDDSSPETQGQGKGKDDDAFKSTSTGQDHTAPYVRR